MKATAALWPIVAIACGWLAEAAQILANAEAVTSETVKARYQRLLEDIREEAAPSPWLCQAAEHFAKVTASYWPHLFPCYEVADLPRTNNDLEQLFGAMRQQLRRATGRKSAPASLILRGSVRLPAAVATRVRVFTAQDLASADLDRWRAKRAALEHCHSARLRCQRFRRDPEAYLHDLEEQTLKLSLRS